MSIENCPLQGSKILIAEDETLISLYLERVLAAAGAEVVCVDQVVDAMAASDAGLDAALLDVSLLDGEVFPAAAALQERGVPLVFHSGHAEQMPELSSYPEAMALDKPAHRSEILDALFSQICQKVVEPGVA